MCALQVRLYKENSLKDGAGIKEKCSVYIINLHDLGLCRNKDVPQHVLYKYCICVVLCCRLLLEERCRRSHTPRFWSNLFLTVFHRNSSFICSIRTSHRAFSELAELKNSFTTCDFCMRRQRQMEKLTIKTCFTTKFHNLDLASESATIHQ